MKKTYGEEDFKISSYHKKDYSSLNTWVTLIWITVGYGLAVAVLFLGWGEAAMEGITLAKLFVFAAVAIGAYVSLLIAYGIGAGSFYKNKHIKAKQRVKKYLRDLSRIEKINNKKEIN